LRRLLLQPRVAPDRGDPASRARGSCRSGGWPHRPPCRWSPAG